MKKGMSLFIMGLILFCVVLVGLGCFWLGTNFGEKVECEEVNENTTTLEITD